MLGRKVAPIPNSSKVVRSITLFAPLILLGIIPIIKSGKSREISLRKISDKMKQGKSQVVVMDHNIFNPKIPF